MVGRKGTGLSAFGTIVLAIVLLIAFGACAIFAQVSTARIVGVVKDTTGALIPGVSINIKQLDTGSTRTTSTSGTGNYTVPLLPVGPDEISTTMPGFREALRKGINVVVGQEAVIDVTLEVGANA